MQSGVRGSTQPQAKGRMGQSQGGMGGPQRSNSVATAPQMGSQPPSNMPYQGPLVLTPVSQLGNAPRRNSRAMSKPDIGSDKAGMSFDPEHYNPDGSLRTMHRMPGFDQSYAQAMKARYIRHSQQLDRERELSVKDIFANKK